MPPKRKAASAASEAIASIQAPATRSTRSKSDASIKKAKTEPALPLLQEGDVLPEDLSPVTTDTGAEVRIQDLAKESGLLIFFYPRANTPGCTTQACGFRDRYTDVSAEGWKIYGMSYDTPKAQTTWKQKYSLQYDLLCDPKGEVLKRLGVTKTLSGNGGGIKRSHVVIEKGGRIKSLKIGVSPAQSIAQGIEAMTGKAVPEGAEAQQKELVNETPVSEPTNTVPITDSVPAVADTTPVTMLQTEVTDTPIAPVTHTIADASLPALVEPTPQTDLQASITQLPNAPIVSLDPVAPGLAPVAADLSTTVNTDPIAPSSALDPTPAAEAVATETIATTTTDHAHHSREQQPAFPTHTQGLQQQL